MKQMSDFIVGNKYWCEDGSHHYQCCGHNLRGVPLLCSTRNYDAPPILPNETFLDLWKEVKIPRKIWAVVRSDGHVHGMSFRKNIIERIYSGYRKNHGPDSCELVHFKEVLDD